MLRLRWRTAAGAAAPSPLGRRSAGRQCSSCRRCFAPATGWNHSVVHLLMRLSDPFSPSRECDSPDRSNRYSIAYEIIRDYRTSWHGSCLGCKRCSLGRGSLMRLAGGCWLGVRVCRLSDWSWRAAPAAVTVDLPLVLGNSGYETGHHRVSGPRRSRTLQYVIPVPVDPAIAAARSVLLERNPAPAAARARRKPLRRRGHGPGRRGREG